MIVLLINWEKTLIKNLDKWVNMCVSVNKPVWPSDELN